MKRAIECTTGANNKPAARPKVLEAGRGGGPAVVIGYVFERDLSGGS